MRHAVRRLLRDGAAAVIVLGTDTPHVSMAAVGNACRALHAGADVVLGPAADGGYWLIGLRRDIPALFCDIPWSTGRVGAVTRALAQEQGLRIVAVREDFDVDDADGLRRLRRVVGRRRREFPAIRRVLAATPELMEGRRA
jgi:hypothetical protein